MAPSIGRYSITYSFLVCVLTVSASCERTIHTSSDLCSHTTHIGHAAALYTAVQYNITHRHLPPCVCACACSDASTGNCEAPDLHGSSRSRHCLMRLKSFRILVSSRVVSNVGAPPMIQCLMIPPNYPRKLRSSAAHVVLYKPSDTLVSPETSHETRRWTLQIRRVSLGVRSNFRA